MGKLYLFLLGQSLIPKISQDNYLNDRQIQNSRLIPETRQDNYLWTADHRLIPETRRGDYLHDQMKQSYTGSFSPNAPLHGLILKQSYTGSFSWSPDAV